MHRRRLRRGIWATTGLLVVVSLCVLAARTSEIDAAARGQGSYCLRTGPLRNADGERVGKGLWWGPDGKRHEVEGRGDASD